MIQSQKKIKPGVFPAQHNLFSKTASDQSSNRLAYWSDILVFFLQLAGALS
jgi:hypothetical protein